MKKRGFTLVELLVVIGIIAVLISLLLPSISMARQHAAIIRCAAQMRDIGNSIQMYCNDNKGFLPPYHVDYGTPQASGNTYGPLWEQPAGGNGNAVDMIYTLTFAGGTLTPAQQLADPGALLNRLYKTRYLSTDKVFQCPSVKDVTATYKSNYYLNPHVALRTYAGVPGGYYLQPWWKKIYDFGKYRGGVMKVLNDSGAVVSVSVPRFKHALMADPVYDIANTTHKRGRQHVWNFLYADGSVQSYFTDSNAARATDKWFRMLDLSNTLQLGADGGKVNFQGAWQHINNVIPIDPS